MTFVWYLDCFVQYLHGSDLKGQRSFHTSNGKISMLTTIPSKRRDAAFILN